MPLLVTATRMQTPAHDTLDVLDAAILVRRALAVALPARSANLPEVPTAAEAGLPDFVVTSMFGLLAPAKTPPAIVAKLTAALEKVLASPDTQMRMDAQGVVTGYLNPADSARRIKAEIDKWTKVAKDANIKLE